MGMWRATAIASNHNDGEFFPRAHWTRRSKGDKAFNLGEHYIRRIDIQDFIDTSLQQRAYNGRYLNEQALRV